MQHPYWQSYNGHNQKEWFSLEIGWCWIFCVTYGTTPAGFGPTASVEWIQDWHGQICVEGGVQELLCNLTMGYGFAVSNGSF